MTLRPTSDKAIFLIGLLLFLLSSCSSSITKPVQLEDFKHGVPFSERMSLKVKDIVIGNVSVRHLFNNIDQKEPSTWEYYSGKENTFNLILSNPNHLEELRMTLAAQNTDRLKVILQDDHGTFLRRIFPGRFNRVIEIPITITPCDEITRIIYTRLNSIIKERSQKEGETDKHIDLDEVFDMLLRDEIEPYIATLDTVKKDDACLKTFQLLKWLRGEDISGFDLGEYNVNEGLQGLLKPVIDALVDEQSGSARYNLNLKILGYTDPVPVRMDKIDLQIDKTGIDEWSKIEDPLDISYSGCSNDNLDSRNPVYIDFATADKGKQIKQKISNNCELGAVRAYVTMIYLINKLGVKGVEYSYATGGVFPSPSDNDKKEDPKKRRVSIELTVKTARANK
jgi:flagellar motor protein MotB